MPAIRPDNIGAPDASAIPRHKGSATKNTTTLLGASYLKFTNGFETLRIKELLVNNG
jgi:hypothetical protein